MMLCKFYSYYLKINVLHENHRTYECLFIIKTLLNRHYNVQVMQH